MFTKGLLESEMRRRGVFSDDDDFPSYEEIMALQEVSHRAKSKRRSLAAMGNKGNKYGRKGRPNPAPALP